jgi:hypothetical protein
MGKSSEVAGENANHGGGGSDDEARARLRGRKRKNSPQSTPGHRLYAPAAGSPNAHYVAPDASGDHRTHAQRGLQIGISPDDGHRMLALASGALGHAR